MFLERKKLWQLIDETLSCINPDYMRHGRRLAYSMLRFCRFCGEEPAATRRLFFTSLFHDIGAYRGEKGADLMNFEAGGTYAHALDGYIFLKYFSPLGADAEPVRFHHAGYLPGELPAAYRDGLKIHLLDRFDILFRQDLGRDAICGRLSAMSGRMFDPKDTQAFAALIQGSDLMERLGSGAYEQELWDYLSTLDFTLQRSYDYLKMLVFTFEVHSRSTVYHSTLAGGVAYLLAQALKLDADLCADAYVAGLVHDLGKVKIPQSILEKPRKLEPGEMQAMKNHVVYTRELIRGYFDARVVDMASRHHEKLDGSGYPLGLTARELSLGDRILCVSDIVSALYTKRSYKDAYDNRTVAGILTRMAESGQLDANVVSAYLTDQTAIMEKLAPAVGEIDARFSGAEREYAALEHDTIGI